MAALLKFLGLVALVGCMVWLGIVAFNRIGGKTDVEQAAGATPVAALKDLGQAEKSASDRSAQAIDCASGDKSACQP
jgi:hypothetical protein